MGRLLILLFWVVSFPAFASTYYVTQAGAGSADGSTLGNAASVATLAGHTAAGDDVISLNGTIISPIAVHNGGTSGHPITYLFASGTKFSAAHWNQSGANGDSAIYADQKSYIVIDGGTNGIVEATANGTALANQQNCNGFTVVDPYSNVEIKNLTVQNIYVRTASSGDSNYFGCGINSVGSSVVTNLSVHDCHLTQAGQNISVNYSAGSTGVHIYNNIISKNGIGINIGSTGTGATLDDLQIYGNDILNDLTWSGYSGVHENNVHVFAVQVSTSVTNCKIYGNYFHGNLGSNPTALCFLEGWVTNALIYDNLFYHDTFGGGNGDLYLKGADGARVMNNTFISNNSSTAIGFGGWAGGEKIASITNNLFYGYGFGYYSAYANVILEADYNIWYPASTLFDFAATYGDSFATWQSVGGFDAHGTQSQPTLDGSYIPTVADTVARDHGVSLSAYFTTDKLGTTRPQGSAWDIGALEYTSGGADTTPPTVTAATILTGGTSLVLTMSEPCTIGAGGGAGLTVTMSGGAVTVGSVSGTNTSSFTASLTGRTIQSGETGTYDYTQPGNSIEDAAGNDLATVSSTAVTNASMQGGSDTGIRAWPILLH